MRLQGITVVLIIISDWFDEYNYHDSLQARLVEGVGHFKLFTG